LKEKEVREFFRTTYDGLLHQDHVPVDEFGEPIAGAIIHRTVQIHAEMHEIKIGGGEPPVEKTLRDNTPLVSDSPSDRDKIEEHLRSLIDGG
jgi:hypothetical protein